MLDYLDDEPLTPTASALAAVEIDVSVALVLCHNNINTPDACLKKTFCRVRESS